MTRPYFFLTRDQARARATRRARFAAWFFLIGAGLTLGAVFALAI